MQNNDTLLGRIRNNLYVLELIELFILGFGLATLVNVVTWQEGDFFTALLVQAAVPLGLWVLWAVYMIYIVVARAGGKTIDILLWVVVAIATSSFTFWCWTVLDLNRLIITKLLYTGNVPVEYAWSAKSKARHKVWNKVMKEVKQTQLGYAQSG